MAYKPAIPDPDAERRKRFRAYCRKLRRWGESGAAGLPPLPDPDLQGLTCGAKRVHGGACRSTVLYPGGRCWKHGGASTGARTPEGKAKARASTRFQAKQRTDTPVNPVQVHEGQDEG